MERDDVAKHARYVANGSNFSQAVHAAAVKSKSEAVSSDRFLDQDVDPEYKGDQEGLPNGEDRRRGLLESPVQDGGKAIAN